MAAATKKAPKVEKQERVVKRVETSVVFKDVDETIYKAYLGPQVVRNNEFEENHDVKAGEVIVVGECGDNYTFLAADLEALVKALK